MAPANRVSGGVGVSQWNPVTWLDLGSGGLWVARASQVIVVASQKGGSGKTSCALNLGVLAHKDAETLLVDCDPQGSLSYWANLRDSPVPKTLPVGLADLETELAAARRGNAAYILVDTPPHNDDGIARALRPADLVIVPVRPTPLDIHAAEATLKLASALARRTIVVLSQCPPSRMFVEAPSVRQARAVFAALGCRVADQTIVYRQSVEHSVGAGKAVSEFAPQGPSDQEFRQLWSQIKSELRRSAERAPAAATQR